MNVAPLYRLYNANSGDHFYTTSIDEANNAASNLHFNREGVTGIVSTSPSEFLIPVYRLYRSGKNDDHFYTNSDIEASHAETLGYRREGIAFYCSNGNDWDMTLTLYRYNRGSDHFYTTDLNEGAASGGSFEGILCYIRGYINN